MELKEKYRSLLRCFNASEGEDFSEVIMRVISSHNCAMYYDAYCDLLPDLGKDELRSCWQFWFADREQKKQDYTSDSLADIVASLLNPIEGDVIYDCCSGTGALSLAVWRKCRNVSFVCEELDSSVVPLLLFNFAVRNINAVVRVCNVLTRECAEQYEVIPGSKYSSIQKSMFPNDDLQCTKSVSNPPFNLKSNGVQLNYEFVKHCMRHSDSGCFILPCGVLSSDIERKQREFLIEKGILNAVVTLPGGFFESTGVNVCVLVCDSRKTDNVIIIDAESLTEEETRLQRGEGSKSHTERIYKKQMKVMNPSQKEALISLVNERRETDISTLVFLDSFREKGYSLMRGVYMKFEPDSENVMHRSYNDIIHEINLIGKARNSFKITINKVWAEELGMKELLMMEQQNKEVIDALNSSLKMMGIEDDIVYPDYISQSNSKELVIRQMDKENLSPVMVSFLPLLKQHIMTMNVFENNLLVELRNALLPALMSGKIILQDNEKSK